jgi:sugar O-acyltransferase (sialic acid O-acetyltransferase NeuD family)
MKKRGILIGGGAFGREVLSWANDRSADDRDVEFDHFLDVDATVLDAFSEYSLKHLGDPDTYVPVEGDVFLIAIGSPSMKERISRRLVLMGGQFARVVHPSAVVSKTAQIGAGVIIGPQSYVALYSVLGDFTCVNSLSGIGHDANIGRYCTISSQADIMGSVQLGERVFVGSGARILPNVKVQQGSKIGAGSIVVKNLGEDSSVFAQPARKI